MLEASPVDAGPLGLEAVRQPRGHALCDPSLPRLFPAQVQHCIAAGAEDIRVEPRGLLHAASPERLKHREQHLLHEILRGGAVAEVTETVGADAIRVSLANASLRRGVHQTDP